MNFAIVPRPALYPGTELLQLLSPRGFVDTGVDMPAGGRVYLAEQTVHEAARLFGYVSPKEAGVLTGENADLREELADLHRRLSDLDPIVKAIHNVAAELVPAA